MIKNRIMIMYPYIRCTQQLYNRIKDILEIIGYNTKYVDKITEIANELVIDYENNFGDVTNLIASCANSANRYRCSNIREFLIKVCKLKGFEVSYVDFVGDNNAENHYFRYILDKDNKNITIYEISEDKGKYSATIMHGKQWKKKLKKEDMIIKYDPAIGESNTVVATMPAKDNDFDKDKRSDLNINKVMEKINIANKLRHCKKGTKLYSPIFGEVKLNRINKINEIWVYSYDGDGNEFNECFNEFGIYNCIYQNAECLLFPSKDNRDWNSFQVLEEGHRVMVSDSGDMWSLQNYYKDYQTKYLCSNDSNSWKYIVPVEDFDFTAEDITINKEKSIV